MKIIQKLLLKALEDESFCDELRDLFPLPRVLELDPKLKYIITMDAPIDQKAERAFVDAMDGFDVVLLTGSKVSIIELDMERLDD